MDDPLPKSAAALEKNYDKVKKGKEDLEAKLNKATILQEKISQLKLGNDFLLETDLSQLDIEMRNKTSKLNTSSVAELEIRILAEEIEKIKSSGRFVPPTDKVQMRNRIEEIQKLIRNAAKVQEEILKAEEDSDFCSEADIEKLKKELDSVQTVFKKLQRLNSGRGYFVMFG